WKTLLQNHPHDSICGCSVDAVHAENLTRFARATEVAEGVAERALAALARRVEPPPEGALRVVLVNTDAAPYRGVVTGTVDLPFASADPGRTVAPERLDRTAPWRSGTSAGPPSTPAAANWRTPATWATSTRSRLPSRTAWSRARKPACRSCAGSNPDRCGRPCASISSFRSPPPPPTIVAAA